MALEDYNKLIVGLGDVRPLGENDLELLQWKENSETLYEDLLSRGISFSLKDTGRLIKKLPNYKPFQSTESCIINKEFSDCYLITKGTNLYLVDKAMFRDYIRHYESYHTKVNSLQDLEKGVVTKEYFASILVTLLLSVFTLTVSSPFIDYKFMPWYIGLLILVFLGLIRVCRSYWLVTFKREISESKVFLENFDYLASVAGE